MEPTFWTEEDIYIPKPGEIILIVRNYRANFMGVVVSQHDSTEKNILEMNTKLRAYDWYYGVSNIQSMTFYQTEDGQFRVANRKKTAPIESLEGRAMMGDIEAFCKLKGIE